MTVDCVAGGALRLLSLPPNLDIDLLLLVLLDSSSETLLPARCDLSPLSHCPLSRLLPLLLDDKADRALSVESNEPNEPVSSSVCMSDHKLELCVEIVEYDEFVDELQRNLINLL